MKGADLKNKSTMKNNKNSIFDFTKYDSPFGDWETTAEGNPKLKGNQIPYNTSQNDDANQSKETVNPKLVSESGGYLLKGNYLKQGIIWKGFRHQWILTNHRTNRLGSLIVPDTDYYEKGNGNTKADKVHIIHTGASGTASDVLRHVDYFTEVKSENTIFYSGVAEQKINGESGEMVDLVFEVEGPLDHSLDPNFVNNAKVFLNGFDIFCNNEGRARKLISLDIDTSQVVVNKNNSEDKFTFQILGKIKLDCQSGECKKLNDETNATLRKFNYTVRLAFLLVGGNSFTATKLTNLNETPKNYSENIIQKTNTRFEVFSLLDNLPHGKTNSIVGAHNYKLKFSRSAKMLPTCTAIHSIKYENRAINHNTKLGVPSGKKHAYAHMLEYDFAIYREFVNNYNILEIGRSLFFKNWHQHIKDINFDEVILFIDKKNRNDVDWQIKNNNHSSTLSFRTGGDFEMEMGLSLLTFDEEAQIVNQLKSTEELYDKVEDCSIKREEYYLDKMQVLKPEIAEGLIERYHQPDQRRPLIVWAAFDTPSDGIYMKGSCEFSEFNLPVTKDKKHEKTPSCDVSFPINSVPYSLKD